MIVKVLEFLFLTSGPVELVPSEPPVFCGFGSPGVFGIMIIFNLIVIPLLILKMRRDSFFDSYFHSSASFMLVPFFFIWMFFVAPSKTAFCEPMIGSPPIEFYPAPPAEAEVPAPPAPPPPPPVIPELAQPLIPDPIRRQELDTGLGLQFLGRTTWEDVTRRMDILELKMLLEKRVEAALVGDGYRAGDLIRKRFEVRDVLFYRGGGEPLAAQTLRRYLSEIDNTGTRSSVPYRRVVRAIQNSDICL